jgi:hypothetical protein
MNWLNGLSLAATFDGPFSDVTRSYAGKGIAGYNWQSLSASWAHGSTHRRTASAVSAGVVLKQMRVPGAPR